MAKEVKETKPQNITDMYPKLYKDISDELVRLMDEIKSEIQWLEQHCEKVVTVPCESEWDLRSLAQLKNKLEIERNVLRRNGYCLSSSSGYIQFLLGEISREELEDRVLRYE